ncbi:MAG: diadenosine tetraphosphate hydrolase [Bacteroidota bacterium]
MNKLFPDELVFESKHFNIHHDWEVPIPGFFIIAPKRTIRTIDEFTEEEAIEYILLTRQLRRGMKEILNIRDVYFFQNEDSKHNFHLWVFPRFDWMERFSRKIESVRPIIDYAKQHLLDKETFELVRSYVKKMRDYFLNQLY